MRVAQAMEVFGEAAKERTSILKGQVMESKRHAEKTAGINAAEAYGKFKTKLREGRADLRALRRESDYDSNSSEAEEVKETIAFFKQKAGCIFHDLQEKSIQPTTITTDALSRHSSTLSSSTLSSRHHVSESSEYYDDTGDKSDWDESDIPSPNPFAKLSTSAVQSLLKDIEQDSDKDDPLPKSSGLSKLQLQGQSVGSGSKSDDSSSDSENEDIYS